MAHHSIRTIPRIFILAAALTLCAQAGCVQRRVTIRTNPPGALVYIDNYQIGTTPVSTDFTYYGTRSIRMVKDGFETLTVKHSFHTPWYEYFPLDFVSENVIPWEIRDERALDFQLLPQFVVPEHQLMERAEGLRRGSIVPLPTGANTVITPATGQTSAGAPTLNAGKPFYQVPFQRR